MMHEELWKTDNGMAVLQAVLCKCQCKGYFMHGTAAWGQTKLLLGLSCYYLVLGQQLNSKTAAFSCFSFPGGKEGKQERLMSWNKFNKSQYRKIYQAIQMNKIIRSCWNAHSQQRMPESGHCEHSSSSKMEMEFCPQQEQGKKWEREQEPSWLAAIEGREQSSATSWLDVEHDVHSMEYSYSPAWVICPGSAAPQWYLEPAAGKLEGPLFPWQRLRCQ